jgi:hypothetical protein
MTGLLRKGEMYLWMLAVALLSILYVHYKGVGLSNDSYQYLSIAENFHNHANIATSIVHFDTESARGTLPAAETTFPPGYPITFSSLYWAHLKPETAGWLVSMFSMIGVVPLLWWGSSIIGASRGLRRLAIAAWVLNSQTIIFSSGVFSEALFTALILAGVVLLIFSETHSGDLGRLAVSVAMVLTGISYWVRYAAILVVAGLIAYLGWLVLIRSSRLRIWCFSLLPCFALVASGMIRNTRLAGTWRGGNDLVVHKSILRTFILFKGVCYHLLFGDRKAGLATGVVLTVLGIVGIIVILFARGRRFDYRAFLGFPIPLSIVLLTGYTAGMIYLGTVTMISFGTRYFVPMFPEFILLCTALLVHLGPVELGTRNRRFLSLFAVAAISGYAYENALSLIRTANVPPHAVLAEFFAEPGPDGSSLSHWIDERLPGDAPILAVDGQATAYVLRRPVVSMVPKAFSSRTWDEMEARRTMRVYSAKYLITYPGLGSVDAPEQDESRFLQALNDGENPSWLIPIVRTNHVAIFEISH